MEPPEPPVPPYSIRAHFNGATAGVLLTGASGYVGSLVLEKLLRSTDCRRIYVLLRPRRGRTPAERLTHLLRSPVFHRLRPPCSGNPGAAGGSSGGTAADAAANAHPPGAAAAAAVASSVLRPIAPAVLARVVAISGDILLPGLGLSEADAAELAKNVDTVIHAAADIRLEAHIHDTLRANYGGTLAVIDLAARLPRLRSLVHVSTCYVNIDRPRGSTVEECLYPLALAGAPLDPSALASELLSTPPSEAAARAAALIRYFGFRNTYALGKRLAEAAAVGVAEARGLPFAVLRPSLVSAVAREPYPGFAGNAAGSVGATAAYIAGLYDDQPSSVAADAGSVWDVVPGDLVAHAIIATAAATAAIHRLRSAAAAAASQGPTAVGPPITTAAAAGPSPLLNGTLAPAAPSPGAAAAAAPLLVVQAATSTTYPITTADVANLIFAFVGAHPRPWTLALRRARPMAPGQRWDPAAWRRNCFWTRVKVRVAAWLCRLLGFSRNARLLEGGHATLATINQPQYDLDLAFSTANLCALEAALAPEERGAFLLVWRPPSASSSDAGGCAGGTSRVLQTEAAVAAAAAAAVAAVADAAADCPGRSGYERSGMTAGVGAGDLLGSSSRTSDEGGGSSGLTGSWGRCSDDSGGGNSGNSSGGEGALERQATAGAAAAGSGAAAAGSGSSGGSSSSSGDGAAACRTAEVPPNAPMGWREFQNTMAAYLYHKIFGVAVPQAAPVPPSRLRALRAVAPQVPLSGGGGDASRRAGGSSPHNGGEWGPVVTHSFAAVER